MEVVVLALIEVWQVPEDANIFERQVVPFICIWVVGNLVVVDVFATSPCASHLHELSLVDLGRSAAFVSVLSRDPSSIDDDSSSVNLYRISLAKSILKRQTTAFVAIQGVDNVETFTDDSIHKFGSRYKHFFGEVELADDKVRLESVVDVPFFFRHSPPSEVHLLPWGAVG